MSKSESKTDLKIIMMAAKYASIQHKNQRRKDSEKTPYINHPIDVAEFLTSNDVNDRETIVGGILHDVIEDTDGTYDEIKNLFGENVAKIVEECSDDKKLNKIMRKRLQIEHAASISDKAKLVKLADKYSNISGLLETPPASWSKDEITGYVYWGFAVCKQLSGINSKIDEQILNLFKKHGINTNVSDKELHEHLEKYYKVIDKSE